MDIKGKHILVVSSVYPPGRHLPYGYFMHYRLLHMQRATQAIFSVFVPSYKGIKQTALDGIRIHRFRYFFKSFEDLTHTAAPRKLNNPLYIAVSALYIVLGALQLLSRCSRQKPDLLWVHWPFPHALIAWPAHKLLGIPMVHTYYSAELLLARRFFFVAPTLRWLTPKAKVVTGNSEYTRKLTQQIVDIPVLVIPDGVAFEETLDTAPSKIATTIPPKDPESSPELIAAHQTAESLTALSSGDSAYSQHNSVPSGSVTSGSLTSGPTKLLCIASFIERKGVRYLLEAMPLVLEHCAVDLRIIGSGPLGDDLRDRCKQLDIESAVEFVGNLDEQDLAQEYRDCDVVVVPSVVDSKGDTEGLGMIAVESMYFGKPAIACAVGGIIDIVKPEVTGLLVPEKDPQALAIAIRDLVKHPDKAKELGKNGQTYYWRSPFSWSSIVSEYQKVFSQAINHS